MMKGEKISFYLMVKEAWRHSAQIARRRKCGFESRKWIERALTARSCDKRALTARSFINDPRHKVESYRFAGSSEQIILAALQTLGMNTTELLSLLGLSANISSEQLTAKTLFAHEWVVICNILYLNIGSISYGYSRKEHLSRIRWALKQGYFRLPDTPRIRVIRREIRSSQKREAQYRDTMLKVMLCRLAWVLRRILHDLR